MKPVDRSLNAELIAGATDGTVKKVVQGRGGIVEATTWRNREMLLDPVQYGDLQPYVHPYGAPVGDGTMGHGPLSGVVRDRPAVAVPSRRLLH